MIGNRDSRAVSFSAFGSVTSSKSSAGSPQEAFLRQDLIDK
jgi:hypothetical protein